MVQAYILVQTEVGKAAEVAIRIGELPGVTQAEDVTGPYDVIVRAEAENVDDLGVALEAVGKVSDVLVLADGEAFGEDGVGESVAVEVSDDGFEETVS